MARYIDAERAKRIIIKTEWENKGIPLAFCQMIDLMPTADVVEVVRCKDCKHRRETVHGSYCLPVFGLKQITDLNGYCSYGERRTDDAL